MEREWAKAIGEGKTVSVDIELVYKGDSARPSSFNTFYTIDGEVFIKSFDNGPKGAIKK